MKLAMLIGGIGVSLALATAPLAAQPPLAPAETETLTEPGSCVDEQVDHTSADVPAEGCVFFNDEEEERARLEQEMPQAFSLFADIFKAEPLTPGHEALVPLGQEMALFIMPDGSFGTAVQSTFAPMVTMITGDGTSDPRTRLGQISGVDAEHLTELSAAERRRAARLIGKSASELDALVPEITDDDDGGEAEPPVA